MFKEISRTCAGMACELKEWCSTHPPPQTLSPDKAEPLSQALQMSGRLSGMAPGHVVFIAESFASYKLWPLITWFVATLGIEFIPGYCGSGWVYPCLAKERSLCGARPQCRTECIQKEKKRSEKRKRRPRAAPPRPELSGEKEV